MKNLKTQMFLKNQMNVSIITSLSYLHILIIFLISNKQQFFFYFFLGNSIEINSTNPISLRKKLEHEDTFSNFGVTPTFQNYVAKKLDEMLEKYVII